MARRPGAETQEQGRGAGGGGRRRSGSRVAGRGPRGGAGLAGPGVAGPLRRPSRPLPLVGSGSPPCWPGCSSVLLAFLTPLNLVHVGQVFLKKTSCSDECGPHYAKKREARSKDVGFIYHSRQLVAPLSQFYILS